MKLKVAPKVSIALSALALVVLLTQSLVQFWQEYRRAIADTIDDGTVFAQLLAVHSRRVYATDGLDAAMRDVTTPNGGVDGVRTRLVLLDHDDSLPAGAAADLRAGKLTTWTATRTRIIVAMPVQFGDQLGAVVVQQDLSVRDAHLVSLVGLVLGAAALLTLASLVFSRFIGEVLVSRPVARLQDMAHRVGAGDPDARVDITSGDEFEALGNSLNDMAAQLSQARAELVRETEARIEALEGLRHADRLATVGKLAAGVAHELGTPMNVVLMRARMIADGQLADPRESARVIADRTEAMASLVRSLLDFARRRSRDTVRLDGPGLLHTVVDLLQPMARKRDMTVTIGPCEPFAVDGDPAGIQQVLSNLVVNALQAMRAGGTVRLGCKTCELTPPVEVGGERGRFACLTVHDEGPGIPPEIRRHLFEPFFSTKGVGEGTGLGLAISWGIARDHGGWVDVETDAEHGTTFALVLPLVTEGAERVGPPAPAPA